MKRTWIHAALLLLATQPVSAASPATKDPAVLWEKFLATGEYTQTITAYEVLTGIGYDGDQVDADLCEQKAAELDSAIETVPVSIALRRAAYLCADAGGDSAATDRALDALAALSRHALKEGGDPGIAKPIRIVAPVDAYALLQGSGLEVTYEYYFVVRPARYLPLVLVGWDAESKTERHFNFDYVDTLHRLKSEEQMHHGMPVVRDWIADAFVTGGESVASVDLAGVRASLEADTLPDRLAKLRGAALAGGVLASRWWLQVCASESAPKDCSDGLVDALLSQAEEKRSFSMALLAFAYADGVGVKANPAAALELLNAAERRWPGGALPVFADMWTSVHGDAKPPAVLQARLEEAAATPGMRRLRLSRAASADKPHFTDADIAFLSDPQQNGLGRGYAILADYFLKLDKKNELWKWTARSAESGNAVAQSWLASAMILGREEKFVPKDLEKGRFFAEQAAQGREGWTARWLSHREYIAGNFQAAEGWLLASANSGDIDTIMQLAGLYAEERPNVSGDAKRAVAIYDALSKGGDEGAPARRALAEMALEGIGMSKDPRQAMALLTTDAEKGDAASQLALAGHYLKGDFGKPDEAQGIRWIQRAIKAGDEDAVTSYGSWLYYDKNTPQSRAEGLSVLAKADAEGNVGATNNYAWVLCTSPLKEIYNPQLGLEVSRRLGDVDELAPGALDTVAACHAANGDFARAIELQTRAARELAAYESPRAAAQRNGKEPGYVRRLGLYKQEKRYEEFERNQ